MKTIPTLFFLLFVFNANAQLVFKNTNIEKSNISKFIVSQNSTQLFGMPGGKEIIVAIFDKVPQFVSSEYAQNKYKITVTQNDKIAKRTYEIHYSLFRQTNGYTGYIKATFEYFDKRPKKITEDYFNN